MDTKSPSQNSEAANADAGSDPKSKTSRGGAAFVAAGIFLSRIAGLVRERVFAHYFGNSWEADAFKAALRIPNVLQNLFGEGVLSASFIPVYSRLLGAGQKEEADRVAGAVATLLFLAVSLFALVGVFVAPHLIDLIAPGFENEKRELTTRIVQILFPGLALLVMSAWCLGVLNSHRRFFLPYVAPVVWNLAIIAGLIAYGDTQSQSELAITAAWALVVGSALQFFVQLPSAIGLLGRLRFSLGRASAHVKRVLSSFSTVVVGRGVVQISAYIDNILASLLPNGALAALAYSQTIYLLPVSLFGMSVSAASLPEISRVEGDGSDEAKAKVRTQVDRALAQIAFFVVPSTFALLILGDVIVAALFQTGKFDHADVIFVWVALIGSSVGLLASTMGRLYASTFYALHDAVTPFRVALVRVAVGTSLGYLIGVWLPERIGIEARWGIAGLTLASSVAGWIELSILRHRLKRQIGPTGLGTSRFMKLFASAGLGAAAGFGSQLVLAQFREGSGSGFHPIIVALIVLPTFGLVYLGLGLAFQIPEARSFGRRLKIVK